MKYYHAIFLISIITINISCKNTSNHKTASDQALDYSDNFNWVSKPKAIEKEVDVFYVYPTIYAGKSPQNMDISDTVLRENAQGLLVAQAGVYSKHANLFAPFYRQQSAAMQSMEDANNGKDAYQDPAFQIGAGDIENAFDYYLKHINPDRPFILAGHSQGTMTLIHLMRKRFKDPVLQERLIAAYLIGYSITKKDLQNYPWMKLAQGKEDTGVIITFNTEGPDAGPSPVLLAGASAINPLNWRTDTVQADRSANQGARFFDDKSGELLEEIPEFAAAHLNLEKGILVISHMKTPQSDQVDLAHMGRWSKGVYHRYDYAFWYMNLQQNVDDRINAYLSSK